MARLAFDALSGLIHITTGRALIAISGAVQNLEMAALAWSARGGSVGVVGECSVGAQVTAVEVYARAVREAPWRAGGAVETRRSKP